MVNRGDEFSLFRSIHAKIDVRIDSSITIRHITTKFDKQLHLEEFTQMRLIKQVMVTSSRQDHMTNKKYYIFTTTVSMKLGRMVVYLQRVLPI